MHKKHIITKTLSEEIASGNNRNYKDIFVVTSMEKHKCELLPLWFSRNYTIDIQFWQLLRTK